VPTKIVEEAKAGGDIGKKLPPAHLSLADWLHYALTLFLFLPAHEIPTPAPKAPWLRTSPSRQIALHPISNNHLRHAQRLLTSIPLPTPSNSTPQVRNPSPPQLLKKDPMYHPRPYPFLASHSPTPTSSPYGYPLPRAT